MQNRTIRTTEPRNTVLIPGFFGMFYVFSTYPKILIEVFTRRNFGRRYFYLTKCLILAFVLGIIPYLFWVRLVSMYENEKWIRGITPPDPVDFWKHHVAGYVFLALFLFFSFKRWIEIGHFVGKVQTEKSSRFTGMPLDFFWTFGRRETIRKEKQGNLSEEEKATLKYNSGWLVECILEPLPFFLLGVLLLYTLQLFGLVLCVAAIFYSFGYIYSYMKSTENMQDIADEMAALPLQKQVNKDVRTATGNTFGASRELAGTQPQKPTDDAPIKVS